MRLAVLSGKGGAGKTMVAVNLAASAESACYVDCDVEEPNGHLFLKPQNISREEVTRLLPEFDREKCIGCRKCVDFCQFNALIFVKDKPMLFDEVCHSCGACMMLCPADAVKEVAKSIGKLEIGQHGNVKVISGILNTGESSGVPVIRAAIKASPDDGLTVLDCPPGSACTVMECINAADFCLLVAEPTAFGFDNFCMVHELVSLLGKPCAAIINKGNGDYPPLEEYCRKHGLPILSSIPYSRKLAELSAKGGLASEEAGELAELFKNLIKRIGGMAK